MVPGAHTNSLAREGLADVVKGGALQRRVGASPAGIRPRSSRDRVARFRGNAGIDAVRREQSWDARGVDEDVVVVLPVAALVVMICSNHHAVMLA